MIRELVRKRQQDPDGASARQKAEAPSCLFDVCPTNLVNRTCLSYGDFKKIFYKGADPSIKRQLALQLGIMSNKPGVSNEKLLRNWFENIRIACNKTAHHDRFWNCIDSKMTPIKPKLYLADATWWGNQWEPFRRPESKGSGRVPDHGALPAEPTGHHPMARQLRGTDGPPSRHPPEKHMGFPDNWQTLPIWQ